MHSPIALKNFKDSYKYGNRADMLLLPDLSISTDVDSETYTGFAYWYEGAWLCIWADKDSIYLTHKGYSTDITGCSGKFRLSLRNLFDLLHRRFVLKRDNNIVVEFETRLDASYYTDITYDMIDFEADNFFAWVKYILETNDPLGFMQAQKPFKPDKVTFSE